MYVLVFGKNQSSGDNCMIIAQDKALLSLEISDLSFISP